MSGSPLASFKNRLNFALAPAVRLVVTKGLRGGRIRKYLASVKEPCLHLGCGPRQFPGWLNSDYFRSSGDFLRSRVLPVDIREPLPFEDESFAFAYTEHVHEHIPYDMGLELCREIRRVLRPGGVFRISTPDVDLLLGLFGRSLTPEEVPIFEKGCEFLGITGRGAPKTPLSLLNAIVGEDLHEYCYDHETLASHLETAGFSSVTRVRPGESSHAALRNLETSTHGRRPDPDLLGFAVWHSLCVEARK